jgi:hypothetical protein
MGHDFVSIEQIDAELILLYSQASHTFGHVTVQLKAWLDDCKPVKTF